MTDKGLTILLVLVVLVAAAIDFRERRIPNALTLTAVVVALGIRALAGSDPFLGGALGAGIAFVVMLPLFAMGGVGGGDAKLLVAVGAFLGPSGFVVAMLASAIAGGLLAAVYSIRRGVILPMLLDTGGLLRYMLTFGRAGERTSKDAAGAVTVPYGVAIAAGTLFAIYWGLAST